MGPSKKRDKAGSRSTILFVYGTLKHGQRNHGLMREARFLGEAITAPHYTLLDLGPFPGLIAGGNTAVHGELYEVEPKLLVRLDRHEGVPRFYIREALHLDGRDNVQSYFLVDSDRVRDGMPLIGGIWIPSRSTWNPEIGKNGMTLAVTFVF
ncbi:gamma-glutamylcyclotransferase [bacterium]|nr:gamma-glutamylcyclotransferase [bacterium]